MYGPIAYTDGACLGNPGPGGWGVRLLYPDGAVRELGGKDVATTNNRMEMQAAIEALQLLHTSGATVSAQGAALGATAWAQGRKALHSLPPGEGTRQPQSTTTVSTLKVAKSA